MAEGWPFHLDKHYRVKLRRGKGWEVKANAEQLDGSIYYFQYGAVVDEGIYAGEYMMIPKDLRYPRQAPTWIASGDLEAVG